MKQFLYRIPKIAWVLILVVAFVLFFFGKAILYHYNFKLKLGIDKETVWIFQDSVIQCIDTVASFTNSRKSDTRNVYHFVKGIDPNDIWNQGINHYYTTYEGVEYFDVTVWRAKALNSLKLDKISIKSNVDLSNVKIDYFEMLDSKSPFPVTVNLTKHFLDGVSVDVENATPMEMIYKENQYVGFYAETSRILVKDKQMVPQILFEYGSEKEPTLFFFFKSTKGVYLIVVNSTKPFSKQFLTNFNLDGSSDD